MKRLLGVLVVSALALTGCGTLPRSGSVEVVSPSPTQDSSVSLGAAPPVTDASPEEIVQGFILAAGAGTDGEYAVARQFLTDDAASHWNPRSQVRVYPDNQNVDPTEVKGTSAQPGAAQPGAAQPGTAQSGTAQSGAAQPSTGNADAAQSEAASADNPGVKTGGEVAGVKPGGEAGVKTSNNAGDTPGDKGDKSSAPAENSGEVSTATVKLSLTSVGTLTENGQYQESSVDAVINSEFGLERNADGQWRISRLDDGTIMSEHFFSQSFVATPLYFLDRTSHYAIADLRWYPRATFTTSALQGLFAGPTGWLKDAAHSAIPRGTQLNGAPTVKDTTMTVDLTAEILTESISNQALAVAQIQETLTAADSEIQAVKVTAMGMELDVGTIPRPEVFPFGSYPITTLQKGKPRYVEKDRTISALSPELEQMVDFERIAVSYEDSKPIYAGLSRGGQTIDIVDSKTRGVVSVFTGNRLVAPSIDHYNWVWSSEQTNGGNLEVATADGRWVSLPSAWLKGATIRDLRVSREGSRLAVLAESAGTMMLYIAAITRDDSHTPKALGEPIQVGQRLSDANSIAWISSTELAVLGRASAGADTSIYQVLIGGPMTRLATVYDGAARLTAGRSGQSVTLITEGGIAVSRNAGAWRTIATGVEDIAYPG
ncbi:lipoprotein LpqB [Actinobaculum suis]|uniref:Lipoprotein LpqB n=2 Tax=Actinobaculum suis TaxID=1657 RepID=A0A7Z9C808_9ACTO|nr:LpqB family beta-propeller domain-containing protein [Actinobaculum suis]VDG75956.1 lipoprotein LpqB [Actinobaculum suis]